MSRSTFSAIRRCSRCQAPFGAIRYRRSFELPAGRVLVALCPACHAATPRDSLEEQRLAERTQLLGTQVAS